MIDYLALKTEIQTDTKLIGFAAPVAAGNDLLVANLLNAVTGPGAAVVSLTTQSKGAVLRGIIPALDQLASGLTLSGAAITPQVTQKWTSRFAALRSGDDSLALDENLLGLFGQLVTDGLTVQPYIDAFTKRVGSRAEALFGVGIFISHGDVAQALRGI